MKNLGKSKLSHTIVLKWNANYVNCQEICYSSIKFYYYLPLQDLKAVRYIHKLVIFEFLITVKVWRDLLKFLLGTKKKLHYIRDFVVSVLVLNRFYWNTMITGI